MNKTSKKNRIKQTTGGKIFSVFNYIFFTLIAVIMIYPFWHVAMQSLSGINETAAGGIFLWPKGFTLSTYQSVFKNREIWRAYGVTVFVTIAGSLTGTLLTAMTAYPLSKSRLRGGKLVMFLIMFTMLFSGGMIPNYILIKNLKLLNSVFALIIPALISAYNVIIMKSFFQSIPESYEEAARIDGANDVRIFFGIIVPLSKATIATIALFNAVMYWNDFFSTVMYINKKELWSLQAYLRNMLTNTAEAMNAVGVNINMTPAINATTIRAASIIVATVPILVVYPFLQKYFVKGVMIGGVKG
ncbi:putative aldouronate transport system permease protein [Anaerotaenia torta]|uniref:carbohydrate ABC transporter permease n=1 Tax=Anaerotaenia torta TaxID=433293 RepID=UPI003D1CAD1F